MARELTSAVPLDDDVPETETADTVETPEKGEGAETEQTEEGVVEATPESALTDLSTEDLEALVGDDNPRGIPKSRFDEVNNERKAFAEQNAMLARALAEREQKAAPAVEDAKPRDFEAERNTLKEKFESNDLDVATYLAEMRKVDRAEDQSELDKKLQPVVKSLEQEREQIQIERLNSRLQTEATKIYEKYPFLNHADEDNANPEAIAKVMAQRDELIAAKIDPVKALRLAVAAVAPDYAPTATAKVDDVANARRIAAQRKAAEASQRQPAALRGTSDRVVDTSEHIGGSVKDHEAWEARQRAQAK